MDVYCSEAFFMLQLKLNYLTSIENHKDLDIRIVNLFDNCLSGYDSFLGTIPVVSKLHIISSIN